jgi:hypothetical protein
VWLPEVAAAVVQEVTVTAWPEPLVYDETEDLAGGYGRAVFNEARTHRYLLERRWRAGKPLTWVMLNPSTADAFADDPTIRRCIQFARRDGYAGIQVVNLFALRATDPRELQSHPDPVGPSNDRVLFEATNTTGVVAAWGAGGSIYGRGHTVAANLARAEVALSCLGATKDGHPTHPLARGRSRVHDDAPFVSWQAAA